MSEGIANNDNSKEKNELNYENLGKSILFIN